MNKWNIDDILWRKDKTMDVVQSVKFDGYKSFAVGTEHEIELDPYVTVFIGKNNCGKSSCIDVLEAALMHGRYISMRSEFQELSVSFPVSESEIRSYFSGSSGGGDISGNHYEHGKRFVGQRLFGTLDIVRNAYSEGYTVGLKLQEGQKHLELPSGKNEWNNILQQHKNYQTKIDFRRINADRDVVPEEETDSENLEHNGLGATNLLRKFINNSAYDEKIIEEKLLSELNKIMHPDSHFTKIRIQQIKSGDRLLWEIFLEEYNGKRFALSKSGSGLKTIILMLINLFVIPHTKAYKGKKLVLAFEELENNLHPALQRKVFEYLYQYAKETQSHIFITTHSHIAINTFFDKENTVIYHVTKSENESKMLRVENHAEKIDILNDLEVQASDLFQSNGIIWVEGPSDRIYINRWLKVFCDSEFIEGSDYQFLYYGGKVLSHYSADEEGQKDLINILTTNQNAAIVIDSDRKSKNSKINATKVRIRDEFLKINGFCWVTQGKEIENYLPAACINSQYGSTLKNIGQYQLFPEYISKVDKNFSGHKVTFAKAVAEHITRDNSYEMLDLEKQIKKLYEMIKKWNKK